MVWFCFALNHSAYDRLSDKNYLPLSADKPFVGPCLDDMSFLIGYFILFAATTKIKYRTCLKYGRFGLFALELFT